MIFTKTPHRSPTWTRFGYLACIRCKNTHTTLHTYTYTYTYIYRQIGNMLIADCILSFYIFPMLGLRRSFGSTTTLTQSAATRNGKTHFVIQRYAKAGTHSATSPLRSCSHRSWKQGGTSAVFARFRLQLTMRSLAQMIWQGFVKAARVVRGRNFPVSAECLN